MNAAARCFHCAGPLGAGPVLDTASGGAPRAFCCAGCAAAARFIAEAGLGDYYALRSAPARRPQMAPTAAALWDEPAWQQAHVGREGTRCEVTLVLDGLRCAACAWLVERALGAGPGVASVEVNVALARMTVAWDPSRVTLSALVRRLEALGYAAQVPGAPSGAAAQQRSRRELVRIGVAGLGTMQAMMFAEALYFGGAGAMPEPTRDALRWIGLALSAPVVFYAGSPFLRGAVQQLRLRRPGMDLLVATSVLLAWLVSLVETVRGGPAVYFDAAVMFVFALLVARRIESAIRARARAQADVLARRQPELALRVAAGGPERVPAGALRVGDTLRVPPGEAVAADGVLLDAEATLSEAILSGESRPVIKRAGDPIAAGSVALLVPVELRVTRVGADTGLAHLVRLVDRARSRRPRVAVRADRWAATFIVAMFAVAAATALAWTWVDPTRAVSATLAVLAVSCPCALSLAVPAALAAVQARLAARGVLVLDPDALAALARADVVLFDKTGTLTGNRASIRAVRAAAGSSPGGALRIAAALQREVAHPWAAAFAPHADGAVTARRLRVHAGAGVEGDVQGRHYRLGSPAYVLGHDDGSGAILLGSDGVELARFEVVDDLREDAAAAVAALQAQGVTSEIISGDAEPAVRDAAQRTGVTAWAARRSPRQKLEQVVALRRAGHVVAMVGDGINDAPVLAGADASIAIGEGVALAQAQAGLLIGGGRLLEVPATLGAARALRRVVRQNLTWAAGYNLLALPVAALGWLPPWLAALGMCASSLLVTLNAARLARTGPIGAGAMPRAAGAAAPPRLADAVG